MGGEAPTADKMEITFFERDFHFIGCGEPQGGDPIRRIGAGGPFPRMGAEPGGTQFAELGGTMSQSP